PIWYHVLTEKLLPTAQFQDFAEATVAMAGELYGVGGQVQTAVAKAMAAVGLPVPPSPTKLAEVVQIRPAERQLGRIRRRREPERKAA
ncbi:MAG TPA: M4 family metallopeptidase, partial [Thermoanaerobaculia bacterium]|nr:M4 family metallopeptidase [Thermoanaerobaculia bacterium]